MADEQKTGPVWVTTYAMRKAGVIKAVSFIKNRAPRGQPWFVVATGPHTAVQANQGDFFTDRPAAVTRVAQMRAAKLASLRKQLAAVEAIDPEKVVPE